MSQNIVRRLLAMIAVAVFTASCGMSGSYELTRNNAATSLVAGAEQVLASHPEYANHPEYAKLEAISIIPHTT